MVMSGDGVGVVSSIWRFPVKSMGGEPVTRADLSATGLLGDRVFALIDTERGKVVSAKSVARFPRILDCQAAFVAEPQAGQPLPPVRITLDSGHSVLSNAPDVDRVLSAHFGHPVALARSAPADFSIDQYHPDVEHADPGGYRDTTVDQKLGAALFAQLGVASPVPVGAFFDVFPLSLVTTSTLARLAELEPGRRWDVRRFRMNIVVATEAPGFAEQPWVGRAVSMGGGPILRVAMPDPRCVMTTRAQADLPEDLEILRSLVRHNRLPLLGGAMCPCLGVYAAVEAGGVVRVGDAVTVAPATRRGVASGARR